MKTVVIFLAFFAFLISCKKSNENVGFNGTYDGTLIDVRDGQTYPIKNIGTQKWLAKNLNVTVYRNGDTIPEVTDSLQWDNLTSAAWCYYGNNSANGYIYGKLYNWYAVNDPRGLAPSGWHIPSDSEWAIMTNYIGGDATAGVKMKTTTGWQASTTPGDNSSGFTGLPAGYRLCGYCSNAGFASMGYYGGYWTSTLTDTSSQNYHWSYSRGLYYNYTDATASYNTEHVMGISVRCIKD